MTLRIVTGVRRLALCARKRQTGSVAYTHLERRYGKSFTYLEYPGSVRALPGVHGEQHKRAHWDARAPRRKHRGHFQAAGSCVSRDASAPSWEHGEQITRVHQDARVPGRNFLISLRWQQAIGQEQFERCL